jgi:hypothetical protein
MPEIVAEFNVQTPPPPVWTAMATNRQLLRGLGGKAQVGRIQGPGEAQRRRIPAKGVLVLVRSSVVPAVVLFALIGLSCGGSATGPSPTPTATPTPTPTPTPQPVTHTLTMIASPSCSALSDAAKKRVYPAQVQEKPDGSIVVLVVNSYDIMIGWGNEPGFTGTRVGNTVHFDLVNDLFAPYSIIESELAYVGTATGTVDNGKIVAIFDGRYVKGYGLGETVLCQASDHRIEITPLGS